MKARLLLVCTLLVAVALAGCAGSSKQDPAPAPAGLVPVEARNGLPFQVDGTFSRTLEAGLYGILPGVGFDVPVQLPATSGADGAAGIASANLGLFLPEIPGCDWTAATLPDQCRVPVIADIGPYYASTRGRRELQDGTVGGVVGEGDTIATEPANRLG
ncbi:MAG TPA: hypothetical protein VFH47_00625, partial [Candidatus Thermoplasmatota archaeon]|nr:hypothetical protein [Candidatus Thermoplasmatota archaeon]